MGRQVLHIRGVVDPALDCCDAIASSNVIRMPAKANQQLAAARRAAEELERIGRGSASDAAIAERTQLSLRTVRSLRAAGRSRRRLMSRLATARCRSAICSLTSGVTRQIA